MQCYRVSDDTTVPESEAFGPNGIRDGYSFRVPTTMRDGNQVRPGEYVGFSMAFMDAALPQQLTDAQRTFAFSPEGRSVIAYAKSVFDAGQAYMPEAQRRVWTADMANVAIMQRVAAQEAAASTPAADAETATRRVIEQAAYVRSTEFNAWRRA